MSSQIRAEGNSSPVSLVALGRSLMGTPIPAEALARSFDQLAILLNTGMPVHQAFRQATAVSDIELAQIGRAVERPLMNGIPLHVALKPWAHRLPEIIIPVLEVGALSGTLDGSSNRLGGAMGQIAGLQRHYRFAIFNPWLVIACLALYGASHSFAESPMVALTMLLTNLVTYSVIYIVGRILLRFVCRWEPLRYTLDSIKLAVPGLGMVARNLSAARWSRSFATLWSCGVPVSTAIEVAARSALNAKYERAFRMAALHTRRGESIADSLTDTQLLPNFLVEIIRTGEISGNLGFAVEQFASELEKEALSEASRQLAFIIAAGQIVLIVAAFAQIAH